MFDNIFELVFKSKSIPVRLAELFGLEEAFLICELAYTKANSTFVLDDVYSNRFGLRRFPECVRNLTSKNILIKDELGKYTINYEVLFKLTSHQELIQHACPHVGNAEFDLLCSEFIKTCKTKGKVVLISTVYNKVKEQPLGKVIASLKRSISNKYTDLYFESNEGISEKPKTTHRGSEAVGNGIRLNSGGAAQTGQSSSFATQARTAGASGENF